MGPSTARQVHEQMQKDIEPIVASLAPLVEANGGVLSPFGESGYDDDYTDEDFGEPVVT